MQKKGLYMIFIDLEIIIIKYHDGLNNMNDDIVITH